MVATESNAQTTKQNLQDYVNELLELAKTSESIAEEDLKTVETSCKQAVSHTFEIAFAGLRSAGKSTTINALLDRELLYSQAGHATGTVCYIRSLPPSETEEKIEITFINQSQLSSKITELCKNLGISNSGDVTQPKDREILRRNVSMMREEQEFPDRKKKMMELLEGLLEAYNKYQNYIKEKNETITLPLNEENRKNAAEYAAWKKADGEVGGGSVIERIDYYCHNDLLDSGNILIDLPGIDAPIQRDRDLTLKRLQDEKTGAVIFMPSVAHEGTLSQEEIDYNTLIQENKGIRSRVFFVFNRVDETWINTENRNQFEQSLKNDFNLLNINDKDETKRIYETSALLGFYTSLIQDYIATNGIESIKIPRTIEGGIEVNNTKIPKQYLISLVNFFRYKKNINFEVDDSTNNDVLAKEIQEILNQKYSASLEDAITESGIPRFRQSICNYVNHKKRPQLYKQLSEDLQKLCRQLQKEYVDKSSELKNYPQTIEELKASAKENIEEELKAISKQFDEHIDQAYRDFITGSWEDFATEYNILKQNTTQFLKDLIDRFDFSLNKLYNQAIFNRRNNYGTAPILSIFVEPFYLLSSELEDFFVKESNRVTKKIFQILENQIQKQNYYHNLEKLLGYDANFLLEEVDKEGQIFVDIIKEFAIRICQEYIRESPHFYQQHDNEVSEYPSSSQTVSFLEILGEILKGIEDKFGEPVPNKDIENSIRDLFRVQFSTDETELNNLYSKFGFQIKVSFGKRLEPMREKLKNEIIHKFDLAAQKSDQRLETEAESKFNSYESRKADLQTKIEQYNQIVKGINDDLNWKSMKLRNLSNCEIEI